MIHVDKSAVVNLNKEFKAFQTGVLNSKKHNVGDFVCCLSRFEKRYKKNRQAESYAKNLFSFAELLSKNGVKDYVGIIYSALMKMPFIQPQAKELYASKALEYARNQGDSIHALARLVDLKILYKQTKQNRKYTQTLFEEEKELIKICSNFRGAKENYRTCSREHSPLRKYELQLAKTRVDIAKVLLKSNPNRAAALLNKARKIFEQEGREKEVKFVDMMLDEIKR